MKTPLSRVAPALDRFDSYMIKQPSEGREYRLAALQTALEPLLDEETLMFRGYMMQRLLKVLGLESVAGGSIESLCQAIESRHTDLEILFKEAAVQLEDAQNLLRELQQAGEWYPSALEIDAHRDNPVDGEELKRRVDAALLGHLPSSPTNSAMERGVGKLYECIGYHRTYSLVGVAKPAGELRRMGSRLDEYTVYRDTEDGQLYVRFKGDFDQRMKVKS